MDDSFFQELDAHITNVGTDMCWKRQIGEFTVWLSPIPFDGQAHANEALARLSKLTETDEASGIDAIQETKRVTLSHAIVGLDSFDLRKFRFAGPCIPTIQVRDGRELQVKAELHRYMYSKISGWGSELVDAVFDVYADLMESHKRELLPPVVEADPLGDERPSPVPDAGSDDDGEQPVSEQNFHPFRPVPTEVSAPSEDELPPVPPPVQTVPVPVPERPVDTSPIQRELDARAGRQASQASVVPTGTRDDPHAAIPSVSGDVLERPAEKQVVQPPRIDSAPQNRNPRFAPPRGR